jgi:rhodanese-related sulfurtransferase
MKKFVKYFMLTLIVSAFVLTACKKDDDDETPTPTPVAAFETLKDYMIASNMDVDVVISGWIIDAAGVNAKGASDFFIIDIRAQADFDLGHIEGAHNATLGTLLSVAADATKPILVACYTGQAAGHAVVALRLSGYADAKVLKWGMSGWNADLSGPWENNVGDAAIGHSAWAAAPGNITSPIVFSTVPNITTTATEGAAILAERVDAMLANGFNGITNEAVLTAPTNYFINNFWAPEDVEHYGNIQPAFRLKPFTLAAETYKNLDASKTVVTYCWTGQTSSMMTAYLYVMGYDAKSLKFGTNGMIYTNLESHQWALPGTNYPVVPTK